MSVAVDANILVYASHTGAPEQERAAEALDAAVGGRDLVYVFWPVLLAYVRIVTHPRAFPQPLPTADAISNLDALLELPNVRCPGERETFWPAFKSVAAEVVPRGKLVSDAHLVALMRANGVRTILTRDRDFRRFDGIRVVDPFA